MSNPENKIINENYNANGGRGFNMALKEKMEKDKLKIIKIKGIKTEDITEKDLIEQKLIYSNGPERRGFKQFSKQEAEQLVKQNNIKVNYGRNIDLKQAGLVSAGHSYNDFKREMLTFNNALENLENDNEFRDLDPVLENEFYSRSV